MTDSALDAAPADGLERAFRLPEHIASDPELLALHDELLRRLRQEAFGIPMHTAQELLLERIVTRYLLIKYRDEHGWVGVTAEKDANAQWLDALKEWNRVLQSSNEQLRDALMREVTKISLEAVELIEDQETRQKVRRHFSTKYAALGQ